MALTRTILNFILNIILYIYTNTSYFDKNHLKLVYKTNKKF